VITPAAARSRVYSALKNGELVRQPCEVCGGTLNIHAHHDDYQKPLEVRWLCSRHHLRHHGQEPKVYKPRKGYESYQPEKKVVIYVTPKGVPKPYKSRRKLPTWFLNKLKLEEEEKNSGRS
jgi:hypothetical protein